MWKMVLPLTLFAFTMTLTPGPNNIMLTASGVNFGYRRTLPHILGIVFGFPAMIVIIGLGLNRIFQTVPSLQSVLKIIGTAYLLFLAWKIARFHSIDDTRPPPRPLTLWQAALFQWVNPKAWVVAVGAVTAYTRTQAGMIDEILFIAVLFSLVTFFGTSTWTVFGTQLRRFLMNDAHRRIFNFGMAALLIVSLVFVFL